MVLYERNLLILLISFSSATNEFCKNYVWVGFLSIEGYVQVSLRKELITDLFV